MGKKRINFICSVEGCGKPAVTKRLCGCHYMRLQRHGNVNAYLNYVHRPERIRFKCLVSGCGKDEEYKGYCPLHYQRLKAGIPLTRGYGNKGSLNPNWKGGIAQYPKHSLFKKIRLEILKEADFKCEICGELARHVHHKDFSKDNHVKENLVPLCFFCHRLLHKERKALTASGHVDWRKCFFCKEYDEPRNITVEVLKKRYERYFHANCRKLYYRNLYAKRNKPLDKSVKV